MKRLRLKEYKKYVLYKAGLPLFPRVFSRDSILSAILANDSNMLRDQLSFCALKQGRKKNSYNGEEPGKIFHEYPGGEMRELSTEFNACDTTALYLIGHEVYQKLTDDKNLAKNQKKNIEEAKNYILSHLKDNLFIEDPEFCGAKKFALKITYWKDSEIIDRKNGEPVYPVVYMLAHVQNMCGLRSAAKILGSEELNVIANKMKESLQNLYDEEFGFYIAIDKLGSVKEISSDLLHALFYLEPGDLSDEQLKKIVEVTRVLETKIGYMVLDPKLSSKISDKYHAETIWPYEQAIIHAGAKKFGLDHVMEVSSRIMKVLDTDPETFVVDKDGFKKSGCDPQLWTIAAKNYFKSF